MKEMVEDNPVLIKKDSVLVARVALVDDLFAIVKSERNNRIFELLRRCRLRHSKPKEVFLKFHMPSKKTPLD